jgi:hypothetical protein
MQVEDTPVGEPPLAEPEAPEEPELDNPPELLPDPVDESSTTPNTPGPPSEPSPVDEDPPQAHATNRGASVTAMPQRPPPNVRPFMTLSSRDQQGAPATQDLSSEGGTPRTKSYRSAY